MTIEQALLAAITALSGTVVFLFAKLAKTQDDYRAYIQGILNDERKLVEALTRKDGRQ